MPFDSTTFRQPKVTVLPPTPTEPPERGGEGPRRILVTIEIVERRPPPKPCSHRLGTLALIVLIIVMLAALAGRTAAHADNGGIRYEHWQDTNGSHGEVRRQGTTTDWTSYGPRGEQKHCHQYYIGDQPITSCN